MRDQRLQVDHAAGLFVSPHALLLKVCVEAVQVARLEVLQLNVTDRLIDPAESDLVLGVRLDLQLLLAEVSHPDLGEVLKSDPGVLRCAGVDALLK